MNTYGVVYDDVMIQNFLKTNSKEIKDLMSFQFLLYFFLLGLIPSYIIAKLKIDYPDIKTNILTRFGIILGAGGMLYLSLFSFSKNYASFFREHKPLRYYVNPIHPLFSFSRYAVAMFTDSKNKTIEHLGRDAFIPKEDLDRELIILVIGETARADRFSLNGHNKKTNPMLENEKVISFKNMTSCGTSTAISVPCIFSNLGRDGFFIGKAKSRENLIDVLGHTSNIATLWRDNNSDSKGVALRTQSEDFQSPTLNRICDSECRDVGMLIGLQEFVDKQTKKDIVIVLHQMGNHGPAYYKRYPPEFEKFKPVCNTNQLEKCSLEEIQNAYDNAILYTDYFLAQAIEFLKKNSDRFQTTLFYVSDHGESLGENGVYLHGMPYFMAPIEQKSVASILWFGGNFKNKIDYGKLKRLEDAPLSHDNVFHTMLGLLEVKTKIYDARLDFLNGILRH